MKTDAPLRLLLIEDDELDRQAVVRALRKSLVPWEIVPAATAVQGLALAAEQHFDAILLDYRLPDQDGIDVLRTLRGGGFENVAVIMLSHHEDESLSETCIETGAQDFLLKSEVNGRRLSRAVRQARHRHLIETELVNSREQLRKLSEHDPLTGLINRRGFELVLEASLARAQRDKNQHLAILLLDLDDFKLINDTLGHDIGDVLLVELARRLKGVVRDSDYLCRLGGDEFVVLMKDFDRDEQAVLLADRIVDMLKIPFQLGDTTQIVTTSIGIATLGSSEDVSVDLLKCADIAMYQAKHEGRNQSRFYSSDLQAVVQFQARMKLDLQDALQRNEFKVFYQPQMSSLDGSLSGIEALIRWQHPTLGLLSPQSFLSIAEETGMIVEIGNWVLFESCRQLKDWQLRFDEKNIKLAVAVNLSAVQIRQNILSDSVRDALDKYQLQPHCLELELTESMLISENGEIAKILSSIAEQGVTLSLDDFGTGYSSMSHLNRFPISVLKIDKAFISLVGSKGKGERLLAAMIAFAKTLDMKVVAEGVETKEQVAYCKQHGCDLLQGYYFSRPLSAVDFESAFLMQSQPLRVELAIA